MNLQSHMRTSEPQIVAMAVSRRENQLLYISSHLVEWCLSTFPTFHTSGEFEIKFPLLSGMYPVLHDSIEATHIMIYAI